MDELQHVIDRKRELLKRKIYSRSVINYSEDMAESEKDRYIRYFVDRVNGADLDKRAMLAVLEDFKDQGNANADSIPAGRCSIQAVRACLRELRAS